MQTTSAVPRTATAATSDSGGLRRPSLWGPRPALLVQLPMVGGAALVVASGWVHLHLWMVGYRDVPTIGPLFLGQAVAGFVLGAALLVLRRWLPAALGALYLLASAGGLLVSDNVGLFGFHDHLDAPYAGLSLVLEGCGAALLAVATAAVLAGRRSRA
jgi:hypothetical protein